jgi:hypothetical protein
MFEPHTKGKMEVQFHYLGTTSLLNAQAALTFPDSSKIRLLSHLEASAFVEALRRANVIARMEGANNFYVKRALRLANRTVIEVRGVATPDSMIRVGESVAELMENLAILSTTLVMRKADLLRKLGIRPGMSAEVNLAVTSKFRRIRSRSKRAPDIEGILMDKSFCNRFTKCGFIQLFEYSRGQGDMNKRVRASADWLLESRRELKIDASIVKTAIALESLLIFSESESLARTLSERSAFILSNAPEVRRKISSILLRFYDARSGVVHGSQKKAKKLTPSLIECVDRLTLMIQLVIASNPQLWPSVDKLRIWCEGQRWDKPFSDVIFPLSHNYLRNALGLVEAEKLSP